MKKKPVPSPQQKWIRTPVAIEIHEKIVYVRNRFGMDNIPEAWRYVISFLLIGRDPEELCQAMAQSAGITLPELEPTLDERRDNPTDG